MNVVHRLMEAVIEFVCWGGGVWWWGLHNHFHVQPNYSVKVVLRLCCIVVGVVTTVLFVLVHHELNSKRATQIFRKCQEFVSLIGFLTNCKL